MNQPHAERAHSKRSPSGLGKYAVCPHFKQDESRPIHPNTLAGTAVHEAIERRDTLGLPDELRPMAKLGIDYWDTIRKRGPWKEHVEISLIIPLVDNKKGHADLVFISEDEKEGILLDWKAGVNLQAEAENNLQQKCYAAAIFEKFPKLEKLEVHIVYVRLGEADVATFTREDVPRIQLEILAVDRRAEEAEKFESENPHTKFYHRADPAVCTYCVKAGTCPELHALTLPTAQAYAKARPEDLTIPEAYDPALISDPATMSKALVVAGVMERWCDSVKHYALQMRMEQGMEIPGTTLSSRKGRSTILNAHEAYKIAEAHGLSHDEIMSAVEVSATKLKDAIEDKAPRGKKKLASTALEDELVEAGVLQVGSESFYLRKTK
jgi:hypothetical protein